jgi:hypothetical protein
MTTYGNWDSSVSIVTDYGLDDQGVSVRVPVRSRIFYSPRRPDRLRGPPYLLSNGYRGLFPGVKQTGSQADHSPSTSAEVKKMWIYTFTKPVTVAERSKAYTVFARWEAGIMGSNPTQGMDVWCLCVCVCVFLCLCTRRGLATSWSPAQGVLWTV